MEKLDEKGFIFLDGRGRPYLCALWGENPWLFYWHPDNHWVSLRQVSQSEIWSMPHNLTADEQDVYHRLHDKYHKSFQPTQEQRG